MTCDEVDAVWIKAVQGVCAGWGTTCGSPPGPAFTLSAQ
jgi:hypothetical protein